VVTVVDFAGCVRVIGFNDCEARPKRALVARVVEVKKWIDEQNTSADAKKATQSPAIDSASRDTARSCATAMSGWCSSRSAAGNTAAFPPRFCWAIMAWKGARWFSVNALSIQDLSEL